ncbi:hypothetical protein HID58_018272, partial [Brassica napus]
GGMVRVQGSEFWHMAEVLRLKAEDSTISKRGLVEGCIQNIDKTGVDFVAQEDRETLRDDVEMWRLRKVRARELGVSVDTFCMLCIE